MTVQVYVGTYAKYNAGSIAGAWINLEDHTADSFAEACAKLHKDESDPELMFQDFEGFPRAMYCESSVSDALWAWIELDEDDRELLEVYQDNICAEGDIDDARDAFHGVHDSPEDYAQDYIESTGMLSDVPASIAQYFDYEAFARDMSFDGVTFARHNGSVWVFSS